MKHDDFEELIQFARVDIELIPIKNHIELLNDLVEGELVYFKRVNTRDLKMHKCYFAMLSYIYSWLPNSFHSAVPRNKFYRWLQTLRGDYKVLFEFKDGRQLLEYESISFARMDENKFRNYIKEQLPYIYENVIHEYYKKETYNEIIENIESEFEKYLTKLHAR